MRLTSRATRAVRERVDRRTSATRNVVGSRLRPFTTAERALPIAVASIVAVAALLAFLPVTPQGAVNGIAGAAATPRIAVNGGVTANDPETQQIAGVTSDGVPGVDGALVGDSPSFQPVVPPDTADGTGGQVDITGGQVDITGGQVDATGKGSAAVAPDVLPEATPTPESALGDDGTLLTGYAPETQVDDGASLIRTYKVQKGQSLADVAKLFTVSKTTLFWVNKLKMKDLKGDLKAGLVLRIPPVSGLVYTVKDTDTLESVAKANKVDPEKIVELNELTDPTLVVGQVLVLPGAKMDPLPTPKPASRVKPAYGEGLSTGVLNGGPSTYAGGKFRWPVVGGNNYVSQYFHYGHYAIDIAADYGSKVVAAADGEVIFAGWKNNGGGYQVWIAHGSGLYTTYNHMSAVTVSRGESVAKGQQVGRIGATGLATGPHCHFEVWRGPVWEGGTRVNPMGYF